VGWQSRSDQLRIPGTSHFRPSINDRAAADHCVAEFQPLLYQVAISALSPGQIASPIREILSTQQNATVVMGDVTGVDKEKKLIVVRNADREGVPIPYDYLILATGATHSDFGHQGEASEPSSQDGARVSGAVCVG
jgi:NADH dehydrogenase FAD-containing subunit